MAPLSTWTASSTRWTGGKLQFRRGSETDLSFTSTSSELDRGRHLLARSTMNRQLIGSATLGYIWLGCSVGSSLTAAPPDHCRTRCRGLSFPGRAPPIGPSPYAASPEVGE